MEFEACGFESFAARIVLEMSMHTGINPLQTRKAIGTLPGNRFA